MLSSNRKILFAWKLLVFLLLTNYQTVVILCNDFFILKFLRDLVLLYILLETFARRPGLTKHYLLPILLLVPFFVLGVINTDGLSTTFITLRKYLFPLGVLVAARNLTAFTKDEFDNFVRYLFNLTFILAIWGVFQAHVLKDTFLINMGYPTIYANAYQRITLRHSYYFGNLGIQRVTATVSNSNVFGIILGITIILVLLHHKKFLSSFVGWLKFICIALGYILTVSRSNFLAMILVAILLLWRYIPHKKKLLAAGFIGVVSFVVLYLVQDPDGISHKLVNWVVKSLTGQESSASGRSSIWADAIDGIRNNPWGIGFGKTGATASGTAQTYACENSYLAMALDMGIGGAVCYVLLELCVLYDLYRSHNGSGSRTILKSGYSILVYFMTVCLFSNHIYDMEAISLVYLLVALNANLLEYSDTCPTPKEPNALALTNERTCPK